MREKFPLRLNIIRWYLLIGSILPLLNLILLYKIDKNLILQNVTFDAKFLFGVLLSLLTIALIIYLFFEIRKGSIKGYYGSLIYVGIAVFVLLYNGFKSFDYKLLLKIIVMLAIAGVFYENRWWFGFKLKNTKTKNLNNSKKPE